MGQALAKQHYTVEEYLEILKDSTHKLAYHDGEIFAMAGGSINHARLSSQISILLHSRLSGSPCNTYSSDLMIGYNNRNYMFADATVICGKPEAWEQNKNAVKNPVLIVEVLSPDTEEYDRTDKFFKYRKIESFKEYVLISQNKMWVEVFYRQEGKDGKPLDLWLYSAYSSESDQIQLRSLAIEISIKELYEGVF
jgi:Uma2 family endonuclease